MKKAIIFDLDGTLWDSTGCACAIWNRVLDQHKEATFHIKQEQVAKLMGKTMTEIGDILFPELSKENRQIILDDFANEEVQYLFENGAILYDEVEQTINSLSKDYDLYIVSNCQDGYVSAFLHAHHLKSYFKDFEMSGRTGFHKEMNIKILMKRNRIQTAVYVGDTEGDEKAAKYAGIPFIYAEYGFGKAIYPSARIKNIKDLPECMKQFF